MSIRYGPAANEAATWAMSRGASSCIVKAIVTDMGVSGAARGMRSSTPIASIYGVDEQGYGGSVWRPDPWTGF